MPDPEIDPAVTVEVAAAAAPKESKAAARAREKAEAEAAAKAAEPLIEAEVRRGTVVVGDHGEEEHVGPGGKVRLPASDVKALRAKGILVDPEAAPAVSSGPKIESNGEI